MWNENKMYLLMLFTKQILKAEAHRQSNDTVKKYSLLILRSCDFGCIFAHSLII